MGSGGPEGHEKGSGLFCERDLTPFCCSGRLPVRTVNSAEPYYDVNGDGFLLPNDVLVDIVGFP